MKQQSELQTVIELLARWISKVRLNNALTFYDINKISEDFACKIINLIYNYELVNLNSEVSNYPGIDLGDKTKCMIAVQVTSRVDGAKVRDTLKIFVNKKYDEVFTSGIKFFIINQDEVKFGKLNPKKIYSKFNKKQDVITDKDLIRKIKQFYNTDPNKFDSIKQLLKSEFGELGNSSGPSISEPKPVPATYLCVYGQESSCFPSGRGMMPIKFIPIQVPGKAPSLMAPMNLFVWKHPKGWKLYTIVCENRKEVIDSNIKIDIYLPMGSSIRSVEISNTDRMLILNGGQKTSSFVSLHIPQLLPDERQECRILIKGTEIREIKAWSEKMGFFEEIFIYDMVFEPPEKLNVIPEKVKKNMFEVG